MLEKIKGLLKRERIAILLIIIISLGSIYKLLLPGFYEPQDLHHIADIYEMFRAFVSGQIPPRWGPDYLYAYGYPLFNFYYVGPFYLGALIYSISGSLQFSYEAVFEIGVIVGAIGFYLFSRNHFSKIASIAGTVLYIYTPYKAVQIYVRGAMGEFLSLALLPWILYFIEKFVRDRKRKWLVFSGFASLFTILSHNYLWVLVFGFCGLYFLLRSLYEKNYLSLKVFLIISLFAVAASTYWWLPAIYEQKLLITQTPFPLIDHFPFIKQLLIPSWGYGASVWGPYDGMSFQLGVVNIIAVLLALILIPVLKIKKLSPIYIWSLISFFVCLFFMNSRSYFVWKIVPFYNLFQFPWRLLAFTGFFSSVLAVITTDKLFDINKKRLGKLSALFFIVASIVLTFNYFKPSQIFYKSDADYLRRMFANQIPSEGNLVSKEYKNYSEDYLLLPKWVLEKPNELHAFKFESIGDDIKILNIKKISEISWEADVAVINPGKLEYYSLYFPGWRAKVDGRETAISYGKSGQIELNLNKGNSKVLVYWTETNFRKVADIVSVISIILGVTLIFLIKLPGVKPNVKKT